MTAAFEREMDELASVVEGLEDTMDVQDVEDLRELSVSMYEGLATICETHAKLRETRGIAVASFLRQPLLTQLSVRYMPPSAALVAGKERQDLKEGLSIRIGS